MSPCYFLVDALSLNAILGSVLFRTISRYRNGPTDLISVSRAIAPYPITALLVLSRLSEFTDEDREVHRGSRLASW